jgi:hypothetical protein
MTLYEQPPLTMGKSYTEIMSKFFVSHTTPTSEHKCKKNYEETSGGMEVADVLYILNCSLCTQQIIPKGGCRETV